MQSPASQRVRYALLDQLACPVCLAPLLCVTQTELPSPMPVGRSSGGARVGRGPGIGPAPLWKTRTALTTQLDGLAGEAAPAERGDTIEVESGLLICACGRSFPIEHSIPELLPDHLRDAERDAALLDAVAPSLPDELVIALHSFRPPAHETAHDPGAHHKKAEIAITRTAPGPMFFAPGYSSPFAYWDSDFSVYLLKLFGAVAPLLGLRRGDCVIDSGCGYAWTTEWLFKSGFDPIGVDICRTYVEVGVARMGVPRPHLVIADAEALPLAHGFARAVLAYESFHHIPDRPRAMRAYERVLQDGGVVILAEPGAAHEHAPVAIDAMQKYGILEKGMELADVTGYAAGTTLRPEQLYLVRLAHAEVGTLADPGFVAKHSVVEGNLFRLVKRASSPAAAAPTHRDSRVGLLGRVRNRLRAALG